VTGTSYVNRLTAYCGAQLLREFDHMGHVCMSFELLGDHLSDLLKQNGPLLLLPPSSYTWTRASEFFVRVCVSVSGRGHVWVWM
jgi:hypothetical protein